MSIQTVLNRENNIAVIVNKSDEGLLSGRTPITLKNRSTIASSTSLAALTDTNTASATEGSILAYLSGKWTATDLDGGSF